MPADLARLARNPRTRKGVLLVQTRRTLTIGREAWSQTGRKVSRLALKIRAASVAERGGFRRSGETTESPSDCGGAMTGQHTLAPPPNTRVRWPFAWR